MVHKYDNNWSVLCICCYLAESADLMMPTNIWATSLSNILTLSQSRFNVRSLPEQVTYQNKISVLSLKHNSIKHFISLITSQWHKQIQVYIYTQFNKGDNNGDVLFFRLQVSSLCNLCLKTHIHTCIKPSFEQNISHKSTLYVHLFLSSAKVTPTCTWMTQYGSGLKDCILSCLSTQNPRVGVWHGPYDISVLSKSPYFPCTINNTYCIQLVTVFTNSKS